MKLFVYLVLGCLLASPLIGQDELAALRAQSGNRKDVTIPFEEANKNIYVRVAVGASRPLWFVLDTGNKYAVIDLSIAKSIGVELGDQVPVGGAGKDIIMGNFVKNSPFTIAGLEGFSQPLFIAVPLASLSSASGREFAGTLGFDFISQFVVEIDYLKKTVTLHDKATFQYHGNGESLPITFNAAAHPQVRAQVIEKGRAPIEGTFVVDIGSGAALLLNTPFVEAEGFLRSGRRTLPWIEGRGFGGSIAGSVGRIQGLKIGSFLIDNPVAVFSQAKVGAFASTDAQGNIGAAILEKFKIILDYGNSRIILEPNSHFAEPIEYNRSGLSLQAVGQDFKTVKVNAIIANSPAEESGLRVGDILSAINGHSAAEYTLSQIRMMFKDAKECDLTVERGSDRLQVKLRLRRLI